MGWVHFFFTITDFWLHRMALALGMVAMHKSGWYLFFQIMCQMLLKVTWAFLLTVVRTSEVTSLCWPDLRHHHDPFVIDCWLHAHSLAVSEPIIVEEVAGLQVIGFGAVVQSLSRARHLVTPWTAAGQAFLSFTISQSLLKLMSIESVILSNRFILSSPSPPAFNLSQQ